MSVAQTPARRDLLVLGTNGRQSGSIAVELLSVPSHRSTRANQLSHKHRTLLVQHPDAECSLWAVRVRAEDDVDFRPASAARTGRGIEWPAGVLVGVLDHARR